MIADKYPHNRYQNKIFVFAQEAWIGSQIGRISIYIHHSAKHRYTSSYYIRGEEQEEHERYTEIYFYHWIHLREGKTPSKSSKEIKHYCRRQNNLEKGPNFGHILEKNSEQNCIVLSDWFLSSDKIILKEPFDSYVDETQREDKNKEVEETTDRSYCFTGWTRVSGNLYT